MSAVNSVTMDTLVSVKVAYKGNIRRFKLGLKDVGPTVFQHKLRELLLIPDSQDVKFERYSDSAGRYVRLDPDNSAVYKQLFRAAKAKLKLRIKVVAEDEMDKPSDVSAVNLPPPSYSTVHLSQTLVSEAPDAPNPSTATVDSVQLENAVSKAVNQYCSGQEFVSHLRETVREEVEKQSPKSSSTSATPADLANCTLKVEHSDIDFQGTQHIYCNICGLKIQGIHYHCDICDGGDYDLCQTCVQAGTSLHSPKHTLNKREIVDGTIAQLGESKIAFASRICNCCVDWFGENDCVSCKDCKDYDLCLKCLRAGQHGHDPRHEFAQAHESMSLESHDQTLLRRGRNVKHAAICDSCDKSICGIRYKCIDCPDWDYCGECIISSRRTHPGHRFVSVLDHSSLWPPSACNHSTNVTTHYGVYCDGPICQRNGTETCIQGVRYICAICPDTDFCVTCEASPLNTHNRTHPLIKLKIPIRNVLVTTIEEKEISAGEVQDLPPESLNSKIPVSPANTATQVQTIADMKPIEGSSILLKHMESSGSVTGKISDPLCATFVGDSIPDGTVLNSGERFTQTWSMENSGTTAWPIGVTVKFVGGDYMFLKSEENTLESTITEHEVQPGECASFSVGLKPTWPPNRNYTSYWRLTAPDGERFGDNIWCCIRVQDPESKKSHDELVKHTEQQEHKKPDKLEELKEFKEKDEGNEKSKEEIKIHDDYESKNFIVLDSVSNAKDTVENAANSLLKSQSSSEMVFPKLSVESPVHSLVQLPSSSTSNSSGGMYLPASPTSTSSHKTFALSEDGDEEIEISSLGGFLTDEEYDVLDASDEEYEQVA